jgi:hypothetical protein
VRGRGAPAGFALADLRHHDGLPGRERLTGDAAERARVADRFEEHQEDVGAALVEQVLDNVEALEAGFVAGADHVAEREALRPAAVQEREAHPAALRDHGDTL